MFQWSSANFQKGRADLVLYDTSGVKQDSLQPVNKILKTH